MAGSGRSLLEALDHWVSNQPSKNLFTFLDDYGVEVSQVTYQGLSEQANALAQHLLASDGAKLKPDDRVLLVYPPSLDFIIAFLACVRAGVIAVPVFPPDPSKLKKDLYMFKAIQSNCDAKVALTSSSYNYAKKIADIKGFFTREESWPTLNWIVTDSLFFEKRTKKVEFSPITDQKVAFLQYTSGSTSEPKGVMITHGNLRNNLDLIVTGLKANTSTVCVSWLPQYHDMGLIGSYLGCLYCGGTGYYMSPISFIRSPPLWLEMISRYRGTHTQAPNFAYGLAARKFLAKKPHPQLDLSSVEHMINAAEPIDSLTIDRFYAVFEKYGLRNGVVFPTYGLAEHTVYVCSNGSQRLVVDKHILESEHRVALVDKFDTWMYAEPSGSLKEEVVKTSVLIGCGKPSESTGMELVIIDPETNVVLPEDRVGEIWVRSKSRAAGYWGNDEKTAEDFGGHIDGDSRESVGFLKTGDLGLLHEGEIFICGRQKDLVIIRGRNHYPQDIERTSEACGSSALRGGCSAAFAVPSAAGSEVLAWVGEVAEPDKVNLPSLVEEIRRAVSTSHGVNVSHIRLLKPRTVPKTTSGKIARAWCKRAFLEHTLQVVHSFDNESLDESPPEDPESLVKETESKTEGAGQSFDAKTMSDQEILEICCKEVAALIQCDPNSLPTDAPLMTLGIDSMGGMQLMVGLENKFRVRISEDVFFETSTTLQTLVPIIKTGGQLGPRALLIDTVKFTELEMINPAEQLKNEKVRMERLMKVSSKASILTGKFADDACKDVSVGLKDCKKEAILLVFYHSALSCAFIVGLVLIFLFFFVPSFAMGLSAMVVFAAYSLKAYFASFPAAGRRHPLKMSLLKYFNFKVVMEGAHDADTLEIFITAPNSSLPVGQLLLASTAESVFGKGFHPLINSYWIEVPVVGYYLCALGARTYSDDIAKRYMSQGKSVGVSIGHPKHLNEDVLSYSLLRRYIRLAMASGASLVPCYGFGNTNVQGIIPSQANIVELVGEPISVPNTSNPTDELIKEYQDLFINALKKLVKTHEEAYAFNFHPQISFK